MPYPTGGQLDGIQVLELGSLIAGPFCTRMLAEMGARVLKVEPPGIGDPLRTWSVVTEHGSLWSLVQSRNKESLAIDLRHPEGQEIVRGLTAKVDILVENFRPGRLESWGLAPEDLRRANPDLIVVRISGFGQTGPYRDRPGFGATGESLGGLRFITGFPDRSPLRVGISLGDAVAGLYATTGALAALHRRHLTGRGEVVDVALHESIFSLLEGTLPEYGYTGQIRERTGNRLSGAVPSNTYPTRDGRFIAIGANGESIFGRFCRALGQEELASDPRFVGNQARRTHAAELDELIEAWTRDHDLDEIWEIMNAAGVPAAPIYGIADIAVDPQYRDRDMILEMEGPGDLGRLLVPGPVPKFKEAPSQIHWLGPRVGQHTESVLRQELGLAASEISRLAGCGVIGLDAY